MKWTKQEWRTVAHRAHNFRLRDVELGLVEIVNASQFEIPEEKRRTFRDVKQLAPIIKIMRERMAVARSVIELLDTLDGFRKDMAHFDRAADFLRSQFNADY